MYHGLNLPPDLVNKITFICLTSLCILFSIFQDELHQLQSSCIPSKWKSADVTPIHKKDSKEQARKLSAHFLIANHQQSPGTLCVL